MTDTPATSRQAPSSRIEDWQRRLIDLSHRNRLIAFRATQATTLTIAAPSIHELLADPDRAEPWDFFFPPEEDDDDGESSAAATTVDELVVSSRTPAAERRPNEIEVAEPSPKRIARILDNLAKRSNSEFQDKALRILYLAVGFLDWHDHQRGKDITSPLVLIPVELRRNSPRDPYRLYFVDDEEIVINPSLTEKLRRDSGLEIPADWAWEDKPIDQELEEIRQAVASTGWTVRDEAVIGLFSFQKYVMYRDLLDNERQIVSHPLVASLASGSLLSEVRESDPDVPELGVLDDVQQPSDSLSILDADASQRQCVEAAKRGRSFVMHGPPGTGKSQTIANVIAEAIGQGKRVLFVSEKAAALDVVHRRLQASGLDEYCLLLHGEHAARREVVEALDRSLNSSLEPFDTMRNSDLERLAHLRTLLNTSVELLHLPQPLLGGRTLREVHELLAQLHFAPSLAGTPAPDLLEGQDVLDEVSRLSEVFERLSERWDVSPPTFVWRGYASGESFTANQQGEALAILRRLEQRMTELAAMGADVADRLGWKRPDTVSEVQRLIDFGEHLVKAPSIEPSWLDISPSEVISATAAAQSAFETAAEAQSDYARELPTRDVTEVEPQVGDRLSERIEAVRRQCGWSPAWESDLARLPAASRALDALPDLLATLRSRAEAAASLCGQPTTNLTPARIGQLADLADLSFKATDRPEQVWLVRAGLERADAALAQVSSDVTAYQESLGDLQRSYAEGMLELEADEMKDRFATQYTSFFSKLSGAYRQDAKAIKATRKDGKLPDEPVAELRQIAELQATGARIDAAAPQAEQALGSYFKGRETAPDEVQRALDVARQVHELNDPEADLQQLAAAVALGASPNPAAAQAADQLRQAYSAVQSSLPDLLRFVGAPPDLNNMSVDELGTWVIALTPAFADLAALVADLDTGAPAPAAGIDESRARAAAADTLRSATAVIDQSSDEWRSVLAGAYRADETDWDAAEHAGRWLAKLRELTHDSVTQPVRDQLVASTQQWSDFRALGLACDAARQAAASLGELFSAPRDQEITEFLESGSFGECENLRRELEVHIDELHDWTEWQRWRHNARQHGWDEFVDALIEAEAPADVVLAAFQKAYWHRRLEALYADDPELADDLRGAAFQRWVDEFGELDRRLVASGADRLIATHERSRTTHVAAPGSEVDLLRREARRKRRHLPVRVLLSRIPELLSELKPCLMMSPLTVSHFLAPDHTFDLVVFDEASQVPPWEAINCIYRGEQLVVAGDSKQLPPTPFFQVAELEEISPDDEDGSTQEDMESILDSCEALLPVHDLQWHYRSRSEALIAFSNRHIYKDRLVTFPSANEQAPSMGVSFVHVADGRYDRGKSATNRREAQVVAQRAMHYLLDGRGRSVGVIAFNSTQATAIGEELDLLRTQHPELEQQFHGSRLDAVFVKHLEAVQGDERDVILFSVGYGPDLNGKFTMNFGPLNKDGGQRRLNVAVTRARERVELVSSVRSTDFKLGEQASAGARLLRDYVAYAESHGVLPEQPGDEQAKDGGATWATPLEEEIASAILELGYEPVPRVGVGSFRIDIGVHDPDQPERFLLGIECDGDGYSRTPTARDRERLRHEVLAGLGWGEIHRIWSLDWVRNRQAEIHRLAAAIAAAEARADEVDAEAPALEEPEQPDEPLQTEVRQRVEREVVELNSSAAAADLPWTEPYARTHLGIARSNYEFHESANRRQQADVLASLIEGEAPISVDYAIRRLAAAWGLQRAGHRVVNAARQALGQVGRRGVADVRGEFIWRPGQTLTRVRIPDPDDPDTRRDIDDIPPEELDLAIARLRESSTGIDDEQLVTQVARIFGFDRTGDRIRTVIAARMANAAS